MEQSLLWIWMSHGQWQHPPLTHVVRLDQIQPEIAVPLITWLCVAVCCSVLQCVAVCCSVLQCVAVRCSVLRCVAVCRSVLQFIEIAELLVT